MLQRPPEAGELWPALTFDLSLNELQQLLFTKSVSISQKIVQFFNQCQLVSVL